MAESYAGPAGARVVASEHLVGLLEDVETAAAALAGVSGPAREALIRQSRRDAARMSARLDGSPLTDETAAAVDGGRAPRSTGSQPPGDVHDAGWATALRLARMDTQDVAALEYANLLACHDLEAHVVDEFFVSPEAALQTLHAQICQGLVAAEPIGTPRRSVQSIHDGAQGMVIYDGASPDRIAGLLAALVAWLAGAAKGVPVAVVAAVVHERILEWQPFEAGNGRLARSAARTILRAGGVDPDGVAVPERVHAGNPAGYYREVAATIRRRGDLTSWVERDAEAMLVALRTAAGPGVVEPVESLPSRARGVADLLPGTALTLPGYATAADVDHVTARRDLRALWRAHVLQPDLGMRGLRYRRT